MDALQIRKSSDRGTTRTGWLQSRHSFAFGGYVDPRFPGFGPLRVINEDWIAPGRGFGPHPHRDMEILTVLVEGTLEHRDDRGNRQRVGPGRVQLMHAGAGIVHSEVNPSPTDPVHLLQIWIEPDVFGIDPGYEELEVVASEDGVAPLATARGAQGGLALHQDASVHWLRLGPGRDHALAEGPGRRRWVQWLAGRGAVDGHAVSAGDGVAVSDGRALAIAADADSPADALIFDLP